MIGLIRTIGRGMTAVSITLMILLCVPITYEAIARFFNAPTIWVFETTLYAFIFLGFCGNALAVQSGSHFRVVMLREMFPAKRRMFDLIAQVSTLAFGFLIIATGSYFVWYSASNAIVSATLLEVPLWIPQLAVPLGGIGLVLQTFAQMVTGEAPAGDAHLVGE